MPPILHLGFRGLVDLFNVRVANEHPPLVPVVMIHKLAHALAVPREAGTGAGIGDKQPRVEALRPPVLRCVQRLDPRVPHKVKLECLDGQVEKALAAQLQLRQARERLRIAITPRRPKATDVLHQLGVVQRERNV